MDQLEYFTNPLNENELVIVNSNVLGRLNVEKAPGTDSKKVLLARVAKLLIEDGLDAEKIIIITTTTTAAIEIKTTLKQKLADINIDVDKMFIGTIYDIGYKFLQLYGSQIGLELALISSESENRYYIKKIFDNLDNETQSFLKNSPKGLELKNGDVANLYYSIDKILYAIGNLQDKGILSDSNLITSDVLSLLYSLYKDQLGFVAKLDCKEVVVALKKIVEQKLRTVEHVLVLDNYELTTFQQELYDQLGKNVTMFGTGFNDAKCLTENSTTTNDILNFTTALKQDFNANQQLIPNFESSFKAYFKHLKSQNDETEWITYQISCLIRSADESLKYSDISIFVPPDYSTYKIERNLKQHKIPVNLDYEFWNAKEVQGILDYLSLAANYYNNYAVFKTLNYPSRGIVKKAFEDIILALDLRDRSIRCVEVLKNVALGLNRNVNVSTKIRESLKAYVTFIEEFQNSIVIADTTTAKFELEMTNIFNNIYIKSNLHAECQKDKMKLENINKIRNLFVDHMLKLNGSVLNRLAEFLNLVNLGSVPVEFNSVTVSSSISDSPIIFIPNSGLDIATVAARAKFKVFITSSDTNDTGSTDSSSTKVKKRKVTTKLDTKKKAKK
ncbi:unnamed protein product [Candida verbasci]|uniref:DNA 3'-5' helicase n=1 Tax=Candida verbasci TaxID=1227364 RepID=A0A9W4TZT0_9ASCO|nr:unnamed protein product [Candida verbasci]